MNSAAINCFIQRAENERESFFEHLLGEFRKSEQLKEDALRLLFHEAFPENADQRSVLVKVTCLNSYYSTRLNSNAPKQTPARKLAVDIATMSQHIAEMDRANKLTELIKAGDLKAVDLIRWVPNRSSPKYSDAYSFATKYCSWHQLDKYPIVDGYSKAMVFYLCDVISGLDKIQKRDLADYDCFRKSFWSLGEWINGKCCATKKYDTKEIDAILWWYAAKESYEGPKIYI